MFTYMTKTYYQKFDIKAKKSNIQTLFLTSLYILKISNNFNISFSESN